MNKLVTLLLLVFATPIVAQPTFTSDQFLSAFEKANSGGTTDYTSASSVGLQTFVTQTGQSQTWDLSSLAFSQGTTSSSGTSVVTYPGGATNASQFPSATHVFVSANGNDTTFEFVIISSSGLYVLGLSEDSSGKKTTQILYSSPLQLFKFPLTYGTQWTSTSTTQTTISGIPVTLTQTVDGVADAWGTVMLPNLTESQCVRVRTKQTLSALTITEASYNFNWYNASGFNLNISADSSQNADGADYSVPQSNSVAAAIAASGVQILGNPAASGSAVQFTMPEDANVKIEVLDVLGKQAELVMNGAAHSGVNNIPIRTDALMNGSYIVRVQSPNFTTTQKLVVSH
jgi:hypothetical protein